jgi:hypothetical protein
MCSSRTLGTAITLVLLWPALAPASDSTERLAREVDQLECGRLDATMKTFLQQSRAHLAALPKLAPDARVRELESYRKALTKAEAATQRCVAGKGDAQAAKVAATPPPVMRSYARLNATIDYALNASSNDPFVYEQLAQGYDDLLAVYKAATR